MSIRTIDRRRFSSISLLGAAGALASPWKAWAADPVPTDSKPTKGSDEQPTPETPSDAPLPFVEGSFTIVALPDTQKYCRLYPKHFYNQTQWIAANKEKYNIAFVAHLGDITDNNVPEQWTVARKAMHTLDGVVPYSLLPGNHDFGLNGKADSRSSFLTEYFSVDGVKKQSTFGGLFDEKRVDNSYHTFQAGDKNFLVLALEWGPRDEVVQWADEIVSKHPDHLAILTTHAYMFHDNTRYDWRKYGKEQSWNPHSYPTAALPGGTNDGQDLWDKLVSKHKNFFLTLNGHVLKDGQGRLTSAGSAKNDVHQVLTNYQNRTEGGQGLMRLIEFLPDGETVQMKTFSPSLDQFKTDEKGQHQFVLKLSPAWSS
jgi:3',5'-cyclic AMP phosphodiesterase CpdA